jgi:Uracil phosphoribosyltransferase
MTIHNLSEKNSILNHFVAELRDISIQHDSLRFRRNLERIGEIISYEISRTLIYTPRPVQTPLGNTSARLYEDRIVLATVLRAGLPFHQGFLNYFDRAENAFISAYRQYNKDHTDFEIITGYLSSPYITGKTLLLVDPMLASGKSLTLAYRALVEKRGEPGTIHIASAIASQPGIDKVCTSFPPEKTTVWTAAIDPGLNESAYIVPGLGDAGDLAYGIKE